MTAHIHAIGTAIPDHDIHVAFIGWAERRIAAGADRKLFDRMAARSGIRHRWSVLPATADGGSPVDQGGFYGDGQPGTAARMETYAREAPNLALKAIASLSEKTSLAGVTHLVVASCTGFVAPGIDQIIARELGLAGSVERTLVGFMGCYAAVAALRTAHHIARSDTEARILVVTVELSTLHLQDADTVEPLLAMLQFGDGAAAALISSQSEGMAIEGFFAQTVADTHELIRWTIGDHGFAMHLSGAVPGRIAQALTDESFRAAILQGRDPIDIEAWAVHAGGRSILDAVEKGLRLPQGALAEARAVLEENGNMSSATLMFVLEKLMTGRKENGVAMAFGPGLAAEGFSFRRAA
ncbi:type III polyketide synthase [Sphingobium sp. DEHP117]|uniref:type III polyketide synthase n=1 Tax=Sphingobium sp. DEHP117 TaxID=2993436 RepID=UPI0027D4F6EF|nr:type III polyketide synthase [Sphingobium sp. DEHP117]MDQ4419454.1 type III polyketide synthase [Sphingobium sp. DEHP117]